jgi:capsular polysaccharide transport system permease protein
LRYSGAFVRWCGVIALLAANTSGQRFRHSSWPAVFAIIEPLGLVVAISAMQDYIGQGPAFGTSQLLFYATGLLPYYLFFHVSLKLRGLDDQRMLPRTNRFDYAIAYIIGDLSVKIIMFIVLLSILLIYYGNESAIPRNVLGCFPPLIELCLIGLSVGLFNMVVMAFWSSWYYVYIIVIRCLMFFSAVFFVLDYSQPQIREIAAYNPLAQSITWFRYEFYTGYPAAYMDLSYLFNLTAGMLAFVLLLEAFTHERRHSR